MTKTFVTYTATHQEWLGPAIMALRSGKQWVMHGNTLEWMDDTILPPLQTEVNDAIRQLQINYQWERIKELRDRHQDGGNLVQGKWFHSDSKSRIQQLALVNMATANQIPPNLMWKTMDGSFVQMTPQLAYAIFFATAMSDQTIFSIAEQHRIAMTASADPIAYDYTVGWPKVYADIPPPVVYPDPVFNGSPTPEMLVNTDVVPEPPPPLPTGPVPTPLVQ